MHTERNAARRAGFTLVELLVVIAIIALLAAMLTPAIIGAMRRGHDTKTLARIHQCELAAQAFFNDYGDYPPTHWDELDEFLKYDSDGDGTYDRATDEVFFFGALDDTTSPSTVNEGIEVFLACVATQTGGPYLEPDGEWLRNVDYTDLAGDLDTATDDVARATNWYLNPHSVADPIFEVVDFWGNPLVYVHNRDYADYDGWDGAAWDTSEAMLYADREGTWDPATDDGWPCYARSYHGTATDNYPNLNSFQLYSWGADEMAGCLENPDDPGTPLEPEAGWWPGWTAASGNLTNWEE